MPPTDNAAPTVLQDIAAAEVAILKGPLLDFAGKLQQPGANLLTLENEIANLGLSLPQLSGPAQSAAFNIIGAALSAWIPTIGASSSPPVSPESPPPPQA